MLEVIAMNCEDAWTAQCCGADRIELVAAPELGGLTPTEDMLKAVLAKVNIPVQVMIRPHANSFAYSRQEIESMCAEICRAEQLGAAGVVVGVLTEGREVDCAALEVLLSAVKRCSVTFHRAIDETQDPTAAVKLLCRHPKVNRILTSGGLSGRIEEHAAVLRKMGQAYSEYGKVILGGGVTLENIIKLKRVLPDAEIHMGTGVRIDKSYQQALNDAAMKRAVTLAQMVERDEC